jgi:hypothetical protein
MKTIVQSVKHPLRVAAILGLICTHGWTDPVDAQSRRFSNRSHYNSYQQQMRATGYSSPSSGINQSNNAQISQASATTQNHAGKPLPPLVAGTGTVVTEVFDDFEDANWEYTFNLPKIYNNGETTLNKNVPAGISNNQLWYEGPKRGQPDLIQRVATPDGGIAGSTGALMLRSRQTGGAYPTRQQQQDDFVCNMNGKTGSIPVSQSPSVVTRVYLPPIEQWEKRTGCHFAFRTSLDTETPLFSSASYRSQTIRKDESWPGIFVNMELKNPQQPISETNPVRLFMWMKADQRGHQLKGPEITELGWWTLGMSFTPDGQVHYYARQGVENLTEEDHLASSFPYGQNAARLRNFFFNVCNGDNGESWSTPFIVDDPKLFIIK